ncbi:hypothetical protein JDV02_006834 [Purpureocillium takamizusanense]|uniref:Uncharacterized protein n=1 Tax=Purpureocillium takamizusanense TaxID=2060973 RepID=A0A9Q8QL26_9HYPO|nr:uncharacterized protein JDV02_006834 [Purpureocillium takamizusanense]UNI20776.1 hypothetical protein JDV02_006834 [Purpureocillium takamizusanense]
MLRDVMMPCRRVPPRLPACFGPKPKGPSCLQPVSLSLDAAAESRLPETSSATLALFSSFAPYSNYYSAFLAASLELHRNPVVRGGSACDASRLRRLLSAISRIVSSSKQ